MDESIDDHKIEGTITIGTWLPIFPGFYNTIFEPNDDFIIEDIKEIEDRKEYELCIDRFWDTQVYHTAYKNYESEVCKYAVEYVERMLKSLDNVIESIEFEEMRSPKEYNFYNDSINVKITFSEKNIDKIKSIINMNLAEWESYLKNCYTSYDGFFSSYSNDKDDWNIEDAIHDAHKCGSILQFICNLNEWTEENMYYDVCESVIFCLDVDELRKELKEEE